MPDRSWDMEIVGPELDAKEMRMTVRFTLVDEGGSAPYLQVSVNDGGGSNWFRHSAYPDTWQAWYSVKITVHHYSSPGGGLLERVSKTIYSEEADNPIVFDLEPGGTYSIWGSDEFDPYEDHVHATARNGVQVYYTSSKSIDFTVAAYVPPSTDVPLVDSVSAYISGSSLVVNYSVTSQCTLTVGLCQDSNAGTSSYGQSVSRSVSSSGSYSFTGLNYGHCFSAYVVGPNNSMGSNISYMQPVSPLGSAILDPANNRSAKLTVQLNGQYYDGALTLSIESQEQQEDGNFGDWKVVAEMAKDGLSSQDYSIGVERVTKFRLRYLWHDKYSSYNELTGTVSPFSCPEIGDFTGVYVFDEVSEIVSSTQAKLRIKHAQQGELSPRSGYRIYIDGSQVGTEDAGVDGQIDEFGPFDFPSKVGKTYSIGIVAFGDGGDSPMAETVMYGRAAPPPSISISRGFNSRYGYWTSAQCDGSLANGYPVRTTISMGKSGVSPVSLVASKASSYTVEFNKETKGYDTAYSASEMDASAVCVPVGVGVSPVTRWYSEPVTAKVNPQGYEIPEGTLSVDLRGVVDEESKVGTYAVTWDEAVYEGMELASLYEVIVYESDGYTERSRTTVDSHRSTGLAKGQQYTYTFDGPFGSCVRVTPKLNGYSGRESFFAADAEGLTFIGPVIVDAWVDGFTGHVVFTPARGGIPRTESSGSKSYRYRVYLGTSRARSKPDDEVFTVRGDRSIEYTFGIYTPYPARVTVSAIDENGNESPRSNSLLVQRFFVQRDVEGVGAYVFSSDLTVRDVGIYGFGYSLMTNGSTVHIQDSDVRVPDGGRLYIVEGDDDVIVETAVTYELET